MCGSESKKLGGTLTTRSTSCATMALVSTLDHNEVETASPAETTGCSGQHAKFIEPPYRAPQPFLREADGDCTDRAICTSFLRVCASSQPSTYPLVRPDLCRSLADMNDYIPMYSVAVKCIPRLRQAEAVDEPGKLQGVQGPDRRGVQRCDPGGAGVQPPQRQQVAGIPREVPSRTRACAGDASGVTPMRLHLFTSKTRERLRLRTALLSSTNHTVERNTPHLAWSRGAGRNATYSHTTSPVQFLISNYCPLCPA